MPAHKKPPELRQRRNKSAEAAELTAPIAPHIPKIPNPGKRAWHALTKSWWKHVWQSPMAPRYLRTDLDALGMIAILIDDFYTAETAKDRLELSKEIRQQTERFGLSNWGRNRMDWTVSAATDKPQPQAPKRRIETSDPRKILKAVK